ncbi:MAG: hypothetical protein KQJ78_25980 [Deltaproteobacteria bacterium]|nr:hypothetical protein [Deltaproteobacteria bacterium]
MSRRAGKPFLASILLKLADQKVPLYKIVIQKFTYFVDSLYFRSGFRFKPFTYGPFSFGLAEALDEMEFAGVVKCRGIQYEVLDESSLNLEISDDLSRKLEDAISQFCEIVDGKFDFPHMEILGTALYCARALKASGEDVTLDAIIKDFKAWKGQKYPDQDIITIVDRMLPYFLAS